MTSLELLTCAVLIFFSAYLSASEMALFSLSRFQLRSLKENFRQSYRKIKTLLSDPGGLLVTILVINEVFNISISTIITEAISRSWRAASPSFQEFLPTWIPFWMFEATIGTLIATPIILFLCEITPKVVGIRINQIVAPLTVSFVWTIYRLFAPARFIMKSIVRLFSSPTDRRSERLLREVQASQKDEMIGEQEKSDGPPEEGGEQSPILKEADFMLMLEEGHKEGAIQENEFELIRNVLELEHMTVTEIVTPLSQVLTLPASITLREALATMRSQRHSRTPITSVTNKKEIVGILHAKDLLRPKLFTDASSASVASVMRKPLFVSSTLKLSTLFRKFKQLRVHMAVVKGRNDEMIGIATMNDILDILFEDFSADESKIGGQTSSLSTKSSSSPAQASSRNKS